MNSQCGTVITIDGPSGSGKGTVSQMLASRLNFSYLDSGALYRLVALAANRHGVALDNHEALAVLAAHMDVAFKMNADGGEPHIILEGEDVSQLIRTEEAGAEASIVAAAPEIRQSLLSRQRIFAQAEGLVADGRDMGTVVFPDAELKIFLTASAEERGERRYNQLIGKGENVSLRALVDKVKERDERDTNREASPLRPAETAIVVDSSKKSIEEVLNEVLELVARQGLMRH